MSTIATNNIQMNHFPFITFEKHPEPKGKCPSCSHEKVFRYYKGLAKEYGKCDREFHCGYQKKPDARAVSETVQKRSETVQDRKIIYPELQLCLKTLNNRMSAFHVFVERTLKIPQTHLRKWNVGTKANDIETAFIYRNRANKDVNIVYIQYNEHGKRDKGKPPYSLSPTEEGRYSFCLFGEHLLSKDHKIICLVESEKTAVIASYFYPQFDWLATGGKDKLTDEKIVVLTGRKVFYLIDADKKENGARKENSAIKRLRNYQVNFTVIDLFLDREDGYDIADAIIANEKPEINPALPLKTLESTISNQPNSLAPVKIRTALQRLEDSKNQPPIKKLLCNFWQSQELAFLFGDTGLGKSILAVSIGDAISKGVSFLTLENEHEPLPVLYYDFELSDKQFEKRYTDDHGSIYPFSSRFYSDTIDFGALMLENPKVPFDELVYNRIVADIQSIEAQVLIVDNITYLNMENTEDTQTALNLMRRLKGLKDALKISVLVLAHTPKRSHSTPLTLKDLAGSKQLSNFADSIFALGQSSKDANLRYLKQVKPSRSGEMIYGANNVVLIEIEKKDRILTFEMVGTENENNHLQEKENEMKRIKEIILSLLDEGKSYREIAKEVNLSATTVFRLINKL